MNNQRIIDWVDGIFASVTPSDRVAEQKEELQTHMEDIIRDYMAEGKDFAEAFAAAKEDMGDLGELLSGEGFTKKKKRKKESATPFDVANAAMEHAFENRSNDPYNERGSIDIFDADEYEKRGGHGWQFRFDHEGIVALSPFIYVALGFIFGWWAWGWMIIPVSAIALCAGDDIRHKIVALSPFIYIALGVAFGWWAWGWIIIPASAIIFEGGFIKFSYRD